MKADLKDIVCKSDVVAVACSGGQDSMALLHFMKKQSDLLGFSVCAINIEHGIRGEDSVKDSIFVKDYCKKNGIPFIFYKIDCLKKAREEKLSVEQAGRILRYNCFYQAIDENKCTKVATAHHIKDNAESVLFNLFRGTGISGVTGINKNYRDKIIRPFLGVTKQEISEYVKKNAIPYVTDKTNFDDDYTRNFIRLNILPKIEEIFPNVQESIYRFSCISKEENDYLESVVDNCFNFDGKIATVSLPVDRAILNRAVIRALRLLGVEKDWEKVHADSVFRLSNSQNGSFVCLPKNVLAVKEYDKIVFFKEEKPQTKRLAFELGRVIFNDLTISIEKADGIYDIKDGFYGDLNKIPKTAVIRTREKGDTFTKFGGGTKSLGDFLTDKKVPVRLRDSLPVLADGNRVLVVFGIAISDYIKVDDFTTSIIKFTKDN